MMVRAGSFYLKGLRLIAILVGVLVTGTAQAEPCLAQPWSRICAKAAMFFSCGTRVHLRRHRLPEAPSTTTLKLERQLDETGRSSAQAMGRAIETLNIPIGEVWSSPTYRARETVRLASLPNPTTAVELGDGGQSMQAISKGQTVWLQAKVAERPRAGTNTIIVTQFPNILEAFGQNASGLAEGEALIVRPGGASEYEIVGRVKIQEWPTLASQR